MLEMVYLAALYYFYLFGMIFTIRKQSDYYTQFHCVVSGRGICALYSPRQNEKEVSATMKKLAKLLSAAALSAALAAGTLLAAPANAAEVVDYDSFTEALAIDYSQAA